MCHMSPLCLSWLPVHVNEQAKPARVVGSESIRRETREALLNVTSTRFRADGSVIGYEHLEPVGVPGGDGDELEDVRGDGLDVLACIERFLDRPPQEGRALARGQGRGEQLRVVCRRGRRFAIGSRM